MRKCLLCDAEVPKWKRYCELHSSTRWRDCNYYQNRLNKANVNRRAFIESGDLGDFEYVEGLTDGNCTIKLRCKTCGTEIQQTIDSIRHHKTPMKCKPCCQREKEERAQAAEQRRERSRIEEEKAKQSRLLTGVCLVCGKEFMTFCPTQKTCGGACSKRYKNHKTDHRIPKSAVVDRDIALATLFKRDKGVCYICGCMCDWDDTENRNGVIIAGPKYPSIDHVIPLSRGGQHAWNNVRLACRDCNSRKTDISPIEYLGTDEYILGNAEILKRVANKQKKAVKQCLSSGEVIAEYESTAEAERATGFKQRQIQNCARGECKTYRGFVWKYS